VAVESAVLRDADFIAWSSDRSGWIVAKPIGPRGGQVLHVDRDGRSILLWDSPHRRLVLPVVSPDGRRVAFAATWTDSNVWMLRGF
jgi:Tol biopolymer transport system component